MKALILREPVSTASDTILFLASPPVTYRFSRSARCKVDGGKWLYRMSRHTTVC